MNKITIFNERFVYLEMINHKVDYLNIINIYLNKYNLKSMDKEDEQLVGVIVNLLFDRLNLFVDYFFYLYKITVESDFRYLGFVHYTVMNEQKYYDVIYNIYIKDKSIIEKYRDIITPKFIRNLLDDNQIIS